jgi:hypothetical protein
VGQRREKPSAYDPEPEALGARVTKKKLKAALVSTPLTKPSVPDASEAGPEAYEAPAIKEKWKAALSLASSTMPWAPEASDL